MYRNVIPLAGMSNGDTLLFQTPQIPASLNQEVEEHLKIVGMFQHLARYSKKMEQTIIELLGFKLEHIQDETNKLKMQGSTLQYEKYNH